jgi:hypothetical protein
MEDKIILTKEQFDELNKRLKGLERNNELLLTIADKKALSQYYQRHQVEVPKDVNVREIDGKVALGWKVIKDEVYYDAVTRIWREIQEVRVLFEDGEKTDMSLVDFTRKYRLIPCQRIGIIKDERTQGEAFKVMRKDNAKEYTIGAQYIN